MVKLVTLLMSLFMILSVAFSQEVNAIHEIKKGSLSNEYIVKTTITGLKGVDIARATYKIDDTHIYSKVLGNDFFSSRDKDYIKFYVMGVPESGIVTIELGVTLYGKGTYSFPVEFQYSRNDEKKTVQFPVLAFTGNELLGSEELADNVAIIETTPKEAVSIEIKEVDPKIEESTLTSTVSVFDNEASEKITIEEVPKNEKEEKNKEANKKLAITTIKEVDSEVEESSLTSSVETVDNEASEKIIIEEVLKNKKEEKTKEANKGLASTTIKEVDPKTEELSLISTEGAVDKEVSEELKTVTIKEELADTKVKYTIQLLALSKFSKARFDAYREEHNLLEEEVSTRVVNGITKVIYGKANSLEEAKKLIDKLKLQNNIAGAFAVPL